MVVPAQEMEAGTNRSLELDAASLASGTYLYQLSATGAEQRYVKTGRMMLVKQSQGLLEGRQSPPVRSLCRWTLGKARGNQTRHGRR